ncbi:MAG: efflux RND transporter permease subunit, partial [Leptospiraceae bacterium]|nr:efflux RND transporter permease subunit [Leptospiraceae bacterium]
NSIDLHITLPKGYFITWAGQFESMQRVRDKMKFILPLTLGLIFILIYINTKSYFKTLVVLLAVPFSLVGAFLLLYVLGYKISVAVWVGLIALMGLDAETGMFMLLYLDLKIREAQEKNEFSSDLEIQTAIVNGAVKRIRPKLMTVLSAFFGLLPIAFGSGTGSDLMKTIAIPMVGGLFTSFFLELLIYPVIYYIRYKKAG